jgi:hypothetical protein
VGKIKGMKTIGFGFLSFLFLMELVCASLYYFQRSSFFYTRLLKNPQLSTHLEGDLKRPNKMNWALNTQFGFSHRPGLYFKNYLAEYLERYLSDPQATNTWGELKANNFGFMSPYDYPVKRKQNSVIIGIFGVSTANRLAVLSRTTTSLITWC